MTEEEIEKLVDSITDRLKGKNGFFIDPETHYRAHQNNDRVMEMFDEDALSDLKSLLRLYRISSGLFLKAFLGFAIIGTIVAAAIGVVAHWFTK